MALRLDVFANARQFMSEMKKSGASVEDISEALDDMARDGDQATEKLERSFKDLASEAKTTGRKIGTSMDEGFDKARKGFGSLKDEAKDSGREAAASFSGDFTDGLDFAQEVAANLGPVGIAGGLIIGAIGATALKSVEEWNLKIDGIKEATAEMWQEAAAEGDSFLSQSAIQAEAHRIIWDKAYEDQFKAAEEAGVSRTDLAVALATGEGTIFDRVTQQLIAAEKDKQAEALRTQGVFRDNYEAAIIAEQQEANGLNSTIDLLDAKAQATQDNKRKAQEASKATQAVEQQHREEIGRTSLLQKQRWEEERKARERASTPIDTTVRFNLDDSAVRNYRPPVIRLRGSIDEIYVTRNGRRIV